jgi:hypothetical protein
MAGCHIGSLSQDESLPDYLGASLTAFLCPDAYLGWTKEQLKKVGKALARVPCPLTSNNVSFSMERTPK